MGVGVPIYETNTFVKYFPFMRYARLEKGWDVHKIPVGHYTKYSAAKLPIAR